MMARGWESKSIESQQDEISQNREQHKEKALTQALDKDQLEKKRQKELLQLARCSIVQQLEASRNPRHGEMLQKALDDIDAKLALTD